MRLPEENGNYLKLPKRNKPTDERGLERNVPNKEKYSREDHHKKVLHKLTAGKDISGARERRSEEGFIGEKEGAKKRST